MDDRGKDQHGEAMQDLLPEMDCGDSATDGLELDDEQSAEIRRIFSRTLPQYLLPVEEMVGSLVAGRSDAEMRQALRSTIASLARAAARLEFEEVIAPLERMSDRVALIEGAEPPPTELFEAMSGDLAEIREAVVRCSDEAGSESPAETLFSALADAEGIDEAVLAKLSGAGLLTVEQLRVAQPSEISAVTGLDDDVVGAIFDHFGVERLANVVDLPLDPAALSARLERAISERKDANESVDEIRREIVDLRADLRERRDKASVIETQRAQARSRLARLAVEIAAREGQLASARAALERSASLDAEASGELRRSASRRRELHMMKSSVDQQEANLDAELSELVRRIQKMLRAVARWPAS